MSALSGATHTHEALVGLMWGNGPQITAADDAFLSIIGFTQEELSAGLIDWRALTPPEYQHLDDAGIRQAAESGGFTIPYQKEFFRKDGSRVPVMLVCAFIPDQPGAWMGYVVDLSPKAADPSPPIASPVPAIAPVPEEFYKRLVSELVHESGRLRTMLNGTATPIWAVDRDLHLLSANAAFAERVALLGQPRIEVGDRVLDRSPTPEARTVWNDWYQRALQGETVCVSSHGSRDGASYALDHTLSPMRAPDGAVIGVSVVSHDVTERMRTEEALRVSESRFRTLASASSLGILLSDARGGFLYANDRLASILDMPVDRLRADSLVEHSHPEDRERFSRELADAHEACSDLVSSFRIQRRGAHGRLESRLLRLWLSAVYEGERCTGFVSTIEDETERQLLADRARQSERMQSLGALAGGIAHDFNNMLAVVLANTDLALGEADVPAPVVEELESIRIASSRAQDLVKQILTFSRQDDSERASIDLTALTAESMRLLRATMSARVDLHVTLPKEPVYISGDASTMQRILLNLCVNADHALRTTPSPKLAVTLRMNDRGPTGEAILEVHDNGIGMTPDVADRVFDPFFTTKPTGEGTGMGLAVVHGAVLAHGGRISVDTAPGHGTTFAIALPRAQQSPGCAPAESQAAAAGGTVLLVDDEPALARAVARSLERRGFQVTTSHDGLDALRLLDEGLVHPDIILSDVAMPNLSGDRLAEQLAQRYPHIPVILMTGFSHDVHPDGPRGVNVVEILQKPMSTRVLSDLVARTLAR